MVALAKRWLLDRLEPRPKCARHLWDLLARITSAHLLESNFLGCQGLSVRTVTAWCINCLMRLGRTLADLLADPLFEPDKCVRPANHILASSMKTW